MHRGRESDAYVGRRHLVPTFGLHGAYELHDIRLLRDDVLAVQQHRHQRGAGTLQRAPGQQTSNMLGLSVD